MFLNFNAVFNVRWTNIILTEDVSRMIIKGGILGSVHHFRDDLYINSTMIRIKVGEMQLYQIQSQIMLQPDQALHGRLSASPSVP